MADFQPFTFGQEFGRSFLESFLQSQKLRQQQDQFERQQESEAKQQSLLDSYRKAQLSNDFVTVNIPEGSPLAQQFGTSGAVKLPTAIADNVLRILNQKVTPPKMTISKIDNNGRQVSVEHVEGQSISTGKIVGETPQWKPKEDNGIDALRKDLANEKKQAAIDKQFEKVDSLVGMTQGGLQQTNGMQGYNTVQNGKGVFVEKSQWKAQARNEVNSLANKLGMTSDVSNLWSGAYKTAKEKYGKNLDEVSPDEKRNFLKSIIDNSQVPDDKKRVLYQYAEIYTR
jgi:hypothetical protein